ncbi:hypothetical protein C8F01DRAFT_1151797, partial [Mycena amicta]
TTMKYHSPLLSDRESISSIQSTDTLRPVPSPSTLATSFEDACSPTGDQRWSEVVPPDTGLTFAVMESAEGDSDAMSFSTSPDFLLSPPHLRRRGDLPTDASTYNRSQVLTLGTSNNSIFTAGLATTPGTMQFFRDNFPFEAPAFFPPPRDRPAAARTQTSSTMDGLDVYLRGSLLGQGHNANRYASCFEEFDGDFEFDPRTPYARARMQAWMKGQEKGKGYVRDDDVSDEGFFEADMYRGMDNEDNLPSRFSMTTTSTSNFVTVEKEKDFETSTATWTALEAPNTPGYSRLMFTPPSDPEHKRRLLKTRPTPGPASPADVLNRPEYNHSRLPFPIPLPMRSASSPSSSPILRSKTPTPTRSPSAGSPIVRSKTPTPSSSTPRGRNLSSRRSLPSLPKLSLSRKRRVPSDSDSATRSAGSGGPGPGWVWIDVKDRKGLDAMAGVREQEEAEDQDEQQHQPQHQRKGEMEEDEAEMRLPIWREHATMLARPQPPLHSQSAPAVARSRYT